LYTELLDRAVNALKSGKQPELDVPMQMGTEVDLQAVALIPEDYLPDIHARLVLYKRIASADSKDELRQLQIEMIDRFGLLPEQVKVLFLVTDLKLQADKIGIKKIDAQSEGGRLIFSAEPKLNMQALLTLIQTQAAIYKFEGGDCLRFSQQFSSTDEKVQFIGALLEQLTESET